MDKREQRQRELTAGRMIKEIERAGWLKSDGGAVFFLRILLSVLFMYLLLLSSELFGVFGTLVVSTLFLTAYFIPVLVQSLLTRLKSSRARKRMERQERLPQG